MHPQMNINRPRLVGGFKPNTFSLLGDKANHCNSTLASVNNNNYHYYKSLKKSKSYSCLVAASMIKEHFLSHGYQTLLGFLEYLHNSSKCC